MRRAQHEAGLSNESERDEEKREVQTETGRKKEARHLGLTCAGSQTFCSRLNGGNFLGCAVCVDIVGGCVNRTIRSVSLGYCRSAVDSRNMPNPLASTILLYPCP